MEGNHMKKSARLLLVLLSATVLSLAMGARAQAQSSQAAPAAQMKPAAQTYSFSSFKAKVETESSELELRASFTLGPQSKGLNPLNEDVSLKVGSYSATIPANSFKSTMIGWFKYEGVINGTELEVRIIPLGSNRYMLRAEAAGKGLEQPVPGPVSVEISIGNDTGSASVKVERGWI
jgi:hypothetical protein